MKRSIISGTQNLNPIKTQKKEKEKKINTRKMINKNCYSASEQKKKRKKKKEVSWGRADGSMTSSASLVAMVTAGTSQCTADEKNPF